MKFHNLRDTFRFDPLLRRSSRFPYEHATPADYAKSGEGPDPLDRDIPKQVATILCVLSVGGALGIALFETVLK